ncbi:hypothetical protein ACOMHN_053551 [Nucella lapillus]
MEVDYDHGHMLTGALGFLVTGESVDDARGNYGILDQQQALKWVSANIKDFGGDPSKVTLFGQSAGAQSTLIHITSASSAPYFRSGIVQSAPLTIPFKRFPEAIVLGGLFAELLNCQPRDLTCLRAKTAQVIAYATHQARGKIFSLKLLEVFEPWRPFMDGDLIKAEPLQVHQEGTFSLKPLLMGSTSEETVLYIYSAWNTSVSDLKYAEVVLATYPAHTLSILSRYVWNHAFSFPGWGPVFFCEGRVCHGSELVYLFHSEWSGNFTFTPDEEILSAQIMDFWTNFAKSGDPNNPGEAVPMTNPLPPKLEWPTYGREGNWPVFKFQTPRSVVATDYHGE